MDNALYSLHNRVKNTEIAYCTPITTLQHFLKYSFENMFCGHLSCFMWTLLEILTFVNKKRYINMFIIVNLSIKVLHKYANFGTMIQKCKRALFVDDLLN